MSEQKFNYHRPAGCGFEATLTDPKEPEALAKGCGQPVDKSGTTFLQRTIWMILLAFFQTVSVHKNICFCPLPTYYE